MVTKAQKNVETIQKNKGSQGKMLMRVKAISGWRNGENKENYNDDKENINLSKKSTPNL